MTERKHSKRYYDEKLIDLLDEVILNYTGNAYRGYYKMLEKLQELIVDGGYKKYLRAVSSSSYGT